MSVVYGGVAVCAALVGLNLAGVFGDWLLVLLLLATVFALPAIGARLYPEQVVGAEQLEAREAARRDVPELWGLDRPLTEDEVLELDARLGMAAAHG
jgi:hypothetical protein